MLTRRNFLQLTAGVGVVAGASYGSLFDRLGALAQEDDFKDLKINRYTVKVGAEKPFKAVHISDTHITFADEREIERKLKLAEARLHTFPKSVQSFAASIAYAKSLDAPILHTGDMIDFLSEKNLEYTRDHFMPAADSGQYDNWFVSAGNHEYSHYLGEAKEDEDYKNASFDRVQKYYPNNLRFASRVINGVNFIAFDDVYYYVADDLIDRFKGEIDKGLPIVTMCHVPFYTEALIKYMTVDLGHSGAWITAVPDDAAHEYYKQNYERWRYQYGNEATFKFVDWIKEQPLIKALLCGHLHVDFDSDFSSTARQYVAGGNYYGAVNEFTFE
ncbi:MAG: metallophosphoesterase [Planctomycetia bacterium]|nr:metallophosphoesterase [Planctomycetia bacterium]